MGNHGGGIPKGGKAKAGSKGVGGGSADKSGKNKVASVLKHEFRAGDHVQVRVGARTGVKGKVKRTIGLNHVHIVPQKGRSFVANVKHLGTVRVGRGYVGV